MTDTRAAAIRRHARHWILALAFVSCQAPLFGAITLTFQAMPGYVSLVGSGTPIAILDFGTVSAFEPLADKGFVKTMGASDFTVSTTFGVKVSRLLTASDSYTLRSRLLLPNPLTWRIDNVLVTTTPATVASGQQYGRVVSHTVGFTVPYSRPGGPVTATIEVIAIAN